MSDMESYFGCYGLVREADPWTVWQVTPNGWIAVGGGRTKTEAERKKLEGQIVLPCGETPRGRDYVASKVQVAGRNVHSQ